MLDERSGKQELWPMVYIVAASIVCGGQVLDKKTGKKDIKPFHVRYDKKYETHPTNRNTNLAKIPEAEIHRYIVTAYIVMAYIVMAYTTYILPTKKHEPREDSGHAPVYSYGRISFQQKNMKPREGSGGRPLQVYIYGL